MAKANSYQRQFCQVGVLDDEIFFLRQYICYPLCLAPFVQVICIKGIVEKAFYSINEFLLITNDLDLVNKSWLRLRINVLFIYDWFYFEHVSKAFVRANFVRGQIIGKVFLLRKILLKSPYLFCFCLNGRWWGDPLNQVHPCRRSIRSIRSIPNIKLIPYPCPILPYPYS